jgi:acyl-ACP thioesterase
MLKDCTVAARTGERIRIATGRLHRTRCGAVVVPPDLVPLPEQGRVFSAERKVRLADAGDDRRARLDALARFLQDVAEDDAADAGLSSSIGWVLRRTRMAIERFPELGESVRLDTFCSGVANRWAERTTTLTVRGRAVAQGVSVWVAVDTTTGLPATLDARFHEVYAPSAAGRRAVARLVLPPPPEGVRHRARPWPLRRSDVDVWGHVNNAISWAAVEDEVDPAAWQSLRADLEHVQSLEPGSRPLLASETTGAGASVWLVDAGSDAPRSGVYTAARLLRWSGTPTR